jgi:hypothetical protein
MFLHILYQEELAWVKKNPEMAAHCFAGEREEQILRDEEDERHCVGDEMERYERTERLLALGKLYRPPAAEQCPAKDEQNETAQQQPDTGGEKSKMSLRQLFEIYGDKPIILHYGKSYSPPAMERCPEKDGPDLDRD